MVNRTLRTLKFVELPDCMYTATPENRVRIELVNDGKGPMGNYNMIYVKGPDWDVAIPAHQAICWG